MVQSRVLPAVSSLARAFAAALAIALFLLGFSHVAVSAADATPPEPFELISPAAGAQNVSPKTAFSWNEATDSESAVEEYEVWVDGAKEGALGSSACSSGVCSKHLEESLTGGAHTWFVRAFDAADNMRESETRSFSVDATPPSAFALIAPPHQGFTMPLPSFEWQPASDEGAGLAWYVVTIDKTTSVEVPAGTETFTPSKALSEGTHTWSVTAIDAVGNSRQTEASSFTVDGLLPSAFPLFEPQSEALTDARPEFRWKKVEDAGKAGIGHYELFLDGEKLAETPAGTESFTPAEDLAHGAHTWFVTAVDKAGNRRDSASQPFVVDGSPPAPFGLLEPADEAVTTNEPRLTWEGAVDDVGVSHYEVFVDGEFAEQRPFGSESYTSLQLADGPHTWSVAAVDIVGNRRESELRTFTVDTASPSPFDLIEPQDGAVTTARPTLGWQAAADQGEAGIDHYEVFIDSNHIESVPVGTESFQPGADLSSGFHFWWISAVDGVGNRTDSPTRGFIVASDPVAAFVEPSMLALTGAPVTLDASASAPPHDGEIVKYEWDLDGDGTFERDTGTTPTTAQTYATVGDVDVAVRVSSNLNTSSIAVGQVSVRPAPPPGHLGVTINNGAEFTNKRKVTISAVWPIFASTALVSNDGGFGAAVTFPLAGSIEWKLDSAGAERLPKTIYVRFQGGTAGRETYQDDIILDRSDPKVTTAALVGGDVVRVHARDATSGVNAVQVASAGEVSKGWRPFHRRVRVPRPHGRTMVRVRDRAGNISRWRRVVIAPRPG
jgi:Bacterial Ig-like domain/PKD domain